MNDSKEDRANKFWQYADDLYLYQTNPKLGMFTIRDEIKVIEHLKRGATITLTRYGVWKQGKD